MRRAFPLLLALASTAEAALPLYVTDMLQSGEAAATYQVGLVRLDADLRLQLAGGPLTAGEQAGSAELAQAEGELVLALGLSDSLNGYLSGGWSRQRYDAELTGSSGGLPVATQQRGRQRGLDDLGVGLQYRLMASETRAMVVRLDVIVPTASDYAGTWSETVNGVEVVALREGRRGQGSTQVSPQLAGTLRRGSGVLEWRLRAVTDDEKATEDRYEAALGWVHHLGETTFLRATAAVGWQPGISTTAFRTEEAGDVLFTLAAGYHLTPGVRLTAAYSYGRAEDAAATYAGGDRLQQQRQVLQGLSLGISYLLP